MRTLIKLLTAALAAVVVPACGTGDAKKNPPVLVNALPAFDAAGVAHFPLLLLEFDRALDPATVTTTNIELFLTDPGTGVHTVPFAGTVLHHIPGTFQVVVENSTVFAADTEYAVVVFPGLLSSEGAPIQALPTGSIALRFEVGNSGNPDRPTFNPPVQVAGGAAGEIVWQWSSAQEGSPLANIGATYELFGSSTSGGQDMFVPQVIPATFPNFTTTGLTPGAQYFFRMIARDNQGNIRLTAEFTGTANP